MLLYQGAAWWNGYIDNFSKSCPIAAEHDVSGMFAKACDRHPKGGHFWPSLASSFWWRAWSPMAGVIHPARYPPRSTDLFGKKMRKWPCYEPNLLFLSILPNGRRGCRFHKTSVVRGPEPVNSPPIPDPAAACQLCILNPKGQK